VDQDPPPVAEVTAEATGAPQQTQGSAGELGSIVVTDVPEAQLVRALEAVRLSSGLVQFELRPGRGPAAVTMGEERDVGARCSCLENYEEWGG